jgi:hypothetical protein
LELAGACEGGEADENARMKMLKRLLICSLLQSFDVWLSHIF